MATAKSRVSKKRAKAAPHEDAAKRVRRTPEEARTLILKAAERVFARQLPDVVGLKDIANEAGVSHALVTHYFGTYSALVEATLERRFQTIREELLPVVMGLVSDEADAKTILSAYRSAVAKAASDPATVRLVTWALLSGRAAADDFFPHRIQGLKLLADAASSRSSVPREDLEFLFIASFAIAVVSTFGRKALAGGLGKKPSRELDAAFDARIEEMIGGYLAAAERRGRATTGTG